MDSLTQMCLEVLEKRVSSLEQELNELKQKLQNKEDKRMIGE